MCLAGFHPSSTAASPPSSGPTYAGPTCTDPASHSPPSKRRRLGGGCDAALPPAPAKAVKATRAKKSAAAHRDDLRKVYAEADVHGGPSVARDAFNEYGRQLDAHKNGERKEPPDESLKPLVSLHTRVSKKESTIRKLELHLEMRASEGVVNNFNKCKALHYSPDDQTVCIDGAKVDFQHHPTTAHRRGGANANKFRPRPQIDEDIAARLNSPIVDENSPEVTRLNWRGSNKSTVFQLRRDSNDPVLREAHESFTGPLGVELEELLEKVSKKHWELDFIGGGETLNIGFGTLGWRSEPALRLTANSPEVMRIIEILGIQYAHLGRILAKYCPKVRRANQSYRDLNEKVACPPISFQDFVHNVFSSQLVIRQQGATKGKHTTLPRTRLQMKRKVPAKPIDRRHTAGSLHLDSGDVPVAMPMFYRACGGKDGKGGPVANTDLLLFQKATGGKSARIKTCIRDTVVIVVANSAEQLHGNVLSSPDFAEDETAWSTRFIPYITDGAYKWMRKNPKGNPYTMNKF